MAGQVYVTVNKVQKVEGDTFIIFAKVKNKSIYAGTTKLAPEAFYFQVRFGYRGFPGPWVTRALADYGPFYFGPGETKELPLECPIANVQEGGGFTFQLIYWVEGGSADNELGWFEGQDGCIWAAVPTDIVPDIAWVGGSLK